MLTVEQAAYVMAQEYPQLVRCKDYWVAHPVNEQLEQTGHADFVAWNCTAAKPTQEYLLQLWSKHEAAWNAREAAADVRNQRDSLLKQADVLTAKAIDAGDFDQVKKIGVYRQALRDVPQQAGFPATVAWPTL